MPIIATTNLPSYARIREQGHEVLSLDRAEHQDIRALHIGVMNMMPDAAMEATERQFLRLLAASNRIVQIYVHLFSPDEIKRDAKAREHVKAYYEPMDEVLQDGLDGLIITGANPIYKDIEQEAYWQPLIRVADWAAENVASTFCSCLASHGLLKHQYGIERTPLNEKCWGIFEHRVVNNIHPLSRNINSRQGIIHSRWNTVNRSDFEAHNLPVLIHSEEVGPHLATSPDGIRFIYAQGHPEYDTSSLLKEYKREVARWFNNEIENYPPPPDNYLPAQGDAILREYQKRIEAEKTDTVFDAFPEELILQHIDNNWQDSARILMSHWIGIIYQLTNQDRSIAFMDGVDKDDPLGIRSRLLTDKQ